MIPDNSGNISNGPVKAKEVNNKPKIFFWSNCSSVSSRNTAKQIHTETDNQTSDHHNSNANSTTNGAILGKLTVVNWRKTRTPKMLLLRGELGFPTKRDGVFGKPR